jgi:hypothetical protein
VFASVTISLPYVRFVEQRTGLIEIFPVFLQLLSGIFAGKNQATGLALP